MNENTQLKHTPGQGVTQQVNKIPVGSVFTILATNVEALMSGSYKAGFFPDGKICLVYNDETREVAQFELGQAQEILEKGLENFFSIVGSVQSKRGL